MIDTYPDAYNHKERKARVDHLCCECRGWIRKGEKYHHHSGIWDGQPESFKICADCTALIDAIDRDVVHRDDMVSFGGLQEELDNSNHSHEIHNRFAAICVKRRDAQGEDQ